MCAEKYTSSFVSFVSGYLLSTANVPHMHYKQSKRASGRTQKKLSMSNSVSVSHSAHRWWLRLSVVVNGIIFYSILIPVYAVYGFSVSYYSTVPKYGPVR